MNDEMLEREFCERLIAQDVDEISAEIMTAEAREGGLFDA